MLASTAWPSTLADRPQLEPPDAGPSPNSRRPRRGRTISVVLPALNEEETVDSVVETITPLLGGLVDELIVLDSGSTDDTEIRAIAAGARVVSRERRCPRSQPQPGKGEVLWRSLAATSGDIVVFVDSDLIDPDPMFVPKLVGPLLTADGVHLVKGFYRRPLKVERQRGRQRRRPGHRAGGAAAAGRAAPRAGLSCCSRWAASTPAPASC